VEVKDSPKEVLEGVVSKRGVVVEKEERRVMSCTAREKNALLAPLG
jgi:hypothetical protein